ncbi:ABC transporter substrate-binding protein [Nocardioides sp. cx-169]|uniref:ABC transporter substrate-binding protein n=1 Tax=Nocardioides sp. cx-169 TaxID=2899080 RepID=UPI001E4AD9ED|nr:ABC transporter substrate-binding protein [Nocardioides sp. cx-169]MCD4532818.1 ABC transporter substrate-binding protein [Nocardioides sp. cx-169]
MSHPLVPRGGRRAGGPVVALAASLVLVLAGCANSDNDADGEDKDAAPAATTRTIEDTMLGPVEDVPTDPQRVVALWRTGALLADIGVKPVGQLVDEFSESELDAETFAEYGDVPVVGTFDGIDVEAVIELEPDLIIGMDNGGLDFSYDELQEIAPTVILDIAEPTDVWANYPVVADLVGETTDFEEDLAELDAELAEVKEQFGEAMSGLQATSLAAFDSTLLIDTSKSLTYQRLAAAGFGYNPTYTDNPERYVTELSLENVADLADQDLILFDVGLDGRPDPETQAVMETASFKRLPAVVKGNVFPLTSGTIYTFAAAEQQVADLIAAAEGYQP